MKLSNSIRPILLSILLMGCHNDDPFSPTPGTFEAVLYGTWAIKAVKNLDSVEYIVYDGTHQYSDFVAFRFKGSTVHAINLSNRSKVSVGTVNYYDIKGYIWMVFDDQLHADSQVPNQVYIDGFNQSFEDLDCGIAVRYDGKVVEYLWFPFDAGAPEFTWWNIDCQLNGF